MEFMSIKTREEEGKREYSPAVKDPLRENRFFLSSLFLLLWLVSLPFPSFLSSLFSSLFYFSFLLVDLFLFEGGKVLVGFLGFFFSFLFLLVRERSC